MIVLDVKRGLKRLRSVTLSQLAAELGEPSSVVEAALSFWESKGCVRRRPAVYGQCAPITCASCPLTSTCGGEVDSHADEYVEWIDDVARRRDRTPTASLPVR